MDFMTFVAVCAAVATAGATAIAIVRIIKSNGSILKGQSGQVDLVPLGRMYSIAQKKIQEFYNGTCKSERKATREVVQAEIRGVREVIEKEIEQVNATLTKGLEDIKTEIRNNGNSDSGSEPHNK